jgi:hypothetical protein
MASQFGWKDRAWRAAAALALAAAAVLVLIALFRFSPIGFATGALFASPLLIAAVTYVGRWGTIALTGCTLDRLLSPDVPGERLGLPPSRRPVPLAEPRSDPRHPPRR